MKKQKFYFSSFDEERAYTLDSIINEMNYAGLTEQKVFLAIKNTDKDFFYCKAFQEVFIKPPEGEPCGKECPDYEPRNGKSGCCKSRADCYEHGPEFKLSIDGKLTPIVSYIGHLKV
jgi:hypothetical protein